MPGHTLCSGVYTYRIHQNNCIQLHTPEQLYFSQLDLSMSESSIGYKSQIPTQTLPLTIWTATSSELCRNWAVLTSNMGTAHSSLPSKSSQRKLKVNRLNTSTVMKILQLMTILFSVLKPVSLYQGKQLFADLSVAYNYRAHWAGFHVQCI